MATVYTITGRPMSTTNSQRIISIPIKGAQVPMVPDVVCPHCQKIAVPEHLGEKPKRPMILKSKPALEWHESAVKQLRKQHAGKPLIEGPVEIALDVYRALNAGDVDNFIKGCLDAIADAGIIANDRQVMTVTATKRVDKVRPRYVVSITELETQGALFDLPIEEEEQEEEPEPVSELPDEFLTAEERKAKAEANR